MGQLSLKEWRERRAAFTPEQKAEDDARRERSRKASADRKAAQQADLEQRTKERLAPEKAREEEKRARDAQIKENTKDTRTWSEKYLGLNLQAGYQAAGETAAGAIAAAEMGVHSALDAMGRPANDRSRPDANRVAVNQMLANKAAQHAQDSGLNTVAKAGMGGLEVLGAVGESGVGVIRTGVGTTVAIGAGLTAGIAESVGANTVARYADAFSEQGAIEAERGVRNIQNAGATIGQNVIDSSLGTNIYGEARKEATGRIGEIAQNRSDAAAGVAGNAGRYLQTGADFVTEAAGSAATDVGVGKLATIAQSRATAAALKVTKPVTKLAGKGIEKATKVGKGIINDFKTEGDFSIFTPKGLKQAGSEIGSDLKELGSGFRQMPDQMGDALIPGRIARKKAAALKVQTEDMRKTFGFDTKTGKRIGSKETVAQDATVARRAQLAQKAEQEAAAQTTGVGKVTDGLDTKTGERIGSREATAQANREAGLARQKVLKESGATKVWRQENRAIDRGVSPSHANNAFVISSKPKVSAQQQQQINDLMDTGRYSQATAMADPSVGPFETVRTAHLKKGTGSFDYLGEVEQRRAAKPRITAQEFMDRQTQASTPTSKVMEVEEMPRHPPAEPLRDAKTNQIVENIKWSDPRPPKPGTATPTSKVMDVMDNNPVTSAQVKEATSAKAAKEAIDSGRVKVPEAPKTPDPSVLDFSDILDDTTGPSRGKAAAAPIRAGVGASADVIEKVATRKQALAENLGAYASSPEAAEALKKSGVFDIGSVEVRDSLKARNVGGDSNLRAAGASYSPSTDTMRLTKNRVNSESIDASIDHELTHRMQEKTIGGLSPADGKTGPLVYEEKLRASLGPDIDKFLSDPKGGYQALRKNASKEANVGNLYTADRIQAEPVELFTSLVQASHSSGFAQNTEAVEMLKKLMKFHGYAKGGIVYASNGALIDAQQGTDRVPAMLTPGEFVVNRQSAQRHMPVLNAINSGHYARGGVVQYLSGGGAVQPAYLANGSIVNNIANSSSQSGVLNNASAAKPAVMEKPAWVDEFISKFNQGASTLVQSATEISSGAGNFASGAQKLSEVSLPDNISLNGNFGFTQDAISNIIGRSVGESVSVSSANSANQVASSAESQRQRIAKSTDYGIT